MIKMAAWKRIVVVLVSTMLLALTSIVSVSAVQYQVGGSLGWKPFVNYTEWSTHQHFYIGDFLYFTYSKAAYKVKEVSKEDYESCLSSEAGTNLTSRNGRDEVELSVAGHYYFVTGLGYCFVGMKLSVLVEQNPINVGPSPAQSPALQTSAPPPVTYIDKQWNSTLCISIPHRLDPIFNLSCRCCVVSQLRLFLFLILNLPNDALVFDLGLNPVVIHPVVIGCYHHALIILKKILCKRTFCYILKIDTLTLSLFTNHVTPFYY
ncbi:hypothetical protein NE237_021738 [Protea cynaroides]|uniref:Phytocyanin domain-containing protein n=1 Tax=Protea cynaroides TaxID=273540 RepID=A0A9Q0H934_9MAGN|nr:hypothetical protein NE237_021738 [Protea cynaroides]